MVTYIRTYTELSNYVEKCGYLDSATNRTIVTGIIAISGVNFTDVSFKNYNFEHVSFINCNFNNTVFDNCIFRATDFESCSLHNVYAKHIILNMCRINNLTISKSKLYEISCMDKVYYDGIYIKDIVIDCCKLPDKIINNNTINTMYIEDINTTVVALIASDNGNKNLSSPSSNADIKAPINYTKYVGDSGINTMVINISSTDDIVIETAKTKTFTEYLNG